MKTIVKVIFFSSVLLHASCNYEDENKEKSISITNNQESVVFFKDSTLSTIDLAKKISANFSQKISTTRSDTEDFVKEILTVKDSTGTDLMYIFNYKDNKGFLITSASQDYTPVLAFNDKGNFDINSIKNNPIEVWFNQEKQNISLAATAPDSIKNNYRKMWAPYYISTKPEAKEKVLTRGSYGEVQNLIGKSRAEWVKEGYMPIKLGTFKIYV